MRPEYTERLMHPKMEYYRICYKDSIIWDGEEPLEGKKVIIYGEQGLGDIIQFVRYVPLLKEAGCEIMLHCPKTLHQLFSEGVKGIDGCFCEEDANEFPVIPDHDYHIPSMSLPFLLNTYEADVPYIHIEEKGVTGFDNVFKVGVAWEGNPHHSNNHQRSCPLSLFRSIGQNDHTQLFMLQQKIHNPKYVYGCDDIELIGAELKNFKDTAKLINSMDLVICVDTSILHLSGALGKKTIGLLSYEHDHRWDLEIDWYPSVKMVTQASEGSWGSIAARLNTQVNLDFQKWKIKHPQF